MRKTSFKVRIFLVMAVVLIMFFLHNNFWTWKLNANFPLLFGFMPFAFFYYILYTVLAAAAMHLIIVLVWPDPPEDILLPVKVEEDQI
ncbi:MAG: hypothetical protein CVU88_04445 [Firmicutes bacterium HGW-Firmicutes-13]|nr:MAG: hypothetical protein CVU88_04445 [Firmicutes bacterium HGW-Firmicutes-13]